MAPGRWAWRSLAETCQVGFHGYIHGLYMEYIYIYLHLNIIYIYIYTYNIHTYIYIYIYYIYMYIWEIWGHMRNYIN